MKHPLIKRLRHAAVILPAFALFASCSKKDNSPGTNGMKAKFTFTVTGAVKDYHKINFNISGRDAASPDNQTIWKVNGETKTNMSHISLQVDDFTGDQKTYVIESVNEMLSPVIFEMTASNSSETTNFHFSYKYEVSKKLPGGDAVTVVKGAGYGTHLNFTR